MALIFLSFICGAYAHGHMLEPSPRGRSKNRNPVRLPATCGGRYDRGNTDSFPIVKKLSPGQSFDVQLLLTANHVGKHWFEYACMDGKLTVPTSFSGARSEKLAIETFGGITETDEQGGNSCKNQKLLTKNRDGHAICNLKLRAPSTPCTHGVMQWNWVAVHVSRTNPEIYLNCVDLQIGTGGGSSVPPTTGTRPRPPIATATRRPTRPVRPVPPRKSVKQQRCESRGCMDYCDMMTRSGSTSEDNTSSVVIGVVFGGIALVVLVGALTGYVFAKKRKEGRRVAGPKE